MSRDSVARECPSRALRMSRAATSSGWDRLVPIQNGTPFASARITDAADLGWPPSRRGPQMFRRSPRGAAPAAGETRRAAPGPRHASPRRRRSLVAVVANLSGAARGALRGESRRVSRGPFLRPAGSRPSDRRGRRRACPPARASGPCDSLRAGHQSRRRSSGRRLVGSLSCARAGHAARGENRDGLRAAQFPKAPARRAQRRPLQLGSLVRGVGAASGASGRGASGRRTTDMARARRLATGRRSHRLA